MIFLTHSFPMPTTTTLKVYEWLAVLALVFVLSALALMAAFTNNETVENNGHLLGAQVQRKIEVVVKGHVDKPGIYIVPSGISLKVILSLVGLRSDSDLRRWRMDRPVKRSRVISINQRQMIQVHLKGAVRSAGPLSVPKGSCLEDLINLADFADNADLAVLQKKRKLKPDETVMVPAKKNE